jgi:hypothetical protein
VADGTAAYILARSSASCSIVRRCSQHFEHGKGRQALDGWTLLEHVTCGIFFFQVFLSLRAGRAPCMDGIGDGGSAAKLARKRLDQDIVTGGASCPCPTPGNMLGTNELDRPNRGVRGGRQTFRSHIPIYMTACSMMIIRHSQAASSQSETQQPLRCVACSSSRPTFPPCAAVLCVVDDRVISVVFLQRTRRTCRVRGPSVRTFRCPAPRFQRCVRGPPASLCSHQCKAIIVHGTPPTARAHVGIRGS